MFAARKVSLARIHSAGSRLSSAAATSPTKDKFKVVVLGGGSAGLAAAQQIYDRFASAGKSLNPQDIAIVDAAEWHHYQPGWTLVGAGLKQKSELRRPLKSLIPSHIAHLPENVQSFDPAKNSITTNAGRTVSYEQLVVATGLQINFNGIEGLPAALEDPNSGVSTIYSYNTADKVWKDIENLRAGRALFTQPAGMMKCPGAPQKIMWMAWDRFRRTGRGDNIKIDYFTGMPTMFSVKKYSDKLNAMRIERGVGGKFGHNLVKVDPSSKIATFKTGDGTLVTENYTFLHAVPPQGPLDVMKGAPIADADGWVDVNKDTLQHVKPEYSNVWAIGDASSLPTARTAAAAIAQAPVLTENLYNFVDAGKLSSATYTGYSSCPLLTGYGQLLLAEFKYGFVPDETFAQLVGDQATPRRLFFHFKKDLFPWAYFNAHVKGKWYGRHGFTRPNFTT